MTHHRLLRHYARSFTPALLLTLVGGVGAAIPVQAVPSSLPHVITLTTAPATSSTVPAYASTAALAGEVQLSNTPPNSTQSVPPNIVMTFDDSGSMAWDFLSDNPPWLTPTGSGGTNVPINATWGGSNPDTGASGTAGPWYCAGVIDPTATSGIGTHVMNGVYYNPNVTYTPPIGANGIAFTKADATLNAVWNDGIAWNRPLNSDSSGGTTDFTNQTSTSWWGGTTTTYWACPYDSGRSYGLGSSGNRYTSTNYSGGTGGPYYYKYTGPTINVDTYGNPKTSADLANLYTTSNWTAVPVPSSQYQNWANWWAYYRTHNQAARTALSRVFGSGNLAAKIVDPNNWDDGGFGSTIRVAWQNLNDGTYQLPSAAIISSLINTSACNSLTTSPSSTQTTSSNTTPPACYRSAFFNWIFQVPAANSTPTRSALIRAGKFFMRGSGNTGASGTLKDPYWQPPGSAGGAGNELTCRQNYHMLITDGLWNSDSGLPSTSTITQTTLPDGASFPSTSGNSVTAIYALQHDYNGGGSQAVSLSDVAYYYWATNLRPDLYTKAQATKGYVPPYLPDQTTSVFNLGATALSGSIIPATSINQEIYFNPKNDPATWPHMSEYLVGMGVNGILNFSQNTDCTNTDAAAQDACALRQGATNSNNIIGWPRPDSRAAGGNGSPANIDDTWHAALAGRGQFFSAGNTQNLIDQLSTVLTSISAHKGTPITNALNTSVLVPGALAFTTGYDTSDWSGTLQAVQANADGSVGTTPLWDAGNYLTQAKVAIVGGVTYSDAPSGRKILTSKENTDGSFGGGIAFEPTSSYDAAAAAALMLPAPTDTTNDTLANRINYLRGVRTLETSGVMHKRSSLLGAIIDSHAVYVGYPASGYTDDWPAGSPEAAAVATGATTDNGSYEQFVQNHINRRPAVYVGANDGMLHAFDASEKLDNSTPPQVVKTDSAGMELFAYVPRAVYGNLGSLTQANFSFLPTVDGTPVTRDVFFPVSKNAPAITTAGWHTILVGNLRNGGRGVYALDITDPTKVTESATDAGSKVLWEFNSDTPASASPGCYASYGTCNPADLGFTYGQPNIGRLANGRWVVLVPGGYFPNCSAGPYNASNCPMPAGAPTAGSPAVAFSSLFVLDAQTGMMIAELKTPINIAGVTSYGLGSPVLGVFNSGQIDNFAFAGDLAGNLWRYDLSSSTVSSWTVSLAYRPTTQGAQPITVMPRLFPDPATNRFIIVFGTGKYLGTNDNTTGIATQAIYGIRDLENHGTVSGTSTLQQQTMAQATVTSGGVTNILRGMTDNTVSATQQGWYVSLSVKDSSNNLLDAGERVVVTPGALFDSNRVVITTLMPSSSDPCISTITGAVMVLNAATGGSGGGISSPGYATWTGSSAFRVVGGVVNNPPTSGSVPVATLVGGGSILTPGLSLTGGGSLTIPDAVWRRRSWGDLDNDQ